MHNDNLFLPSSPHTHNTNAHTTHTCTLTHHRHGNGNFYSCRGIQLAVDYFRKRGHDKITVFVPDFRKEASKPETEQEVLHLLEREGVLKYTPSRRIRGKRIACYDDRFILDLAVHEDGVIVSNDQFRDLMDEKPEWRKVIETRLLPFQFVDNYFIIPGDPKGKDNPTLDQVLTKCPRDVPGKQLTSSASRTQSNRQICPYLEKCTFGQKCKYYHPGRDQRKDVMPTSISQNTTSHIDSQILSTSQSSTPPPSPEKWSRSRYLHSSGMGRVELKVGSPRIHTELSQQHGSPIPAGYFHQRPVPSDSMNCNPPLVIGKSHLAPMFSTHSAELAASVPGAGVVCDSKHLSHRYTFPAVIVPQSHHIKSSGTHNLTEHHHLSSTSTPIHQSSRIGRTTEGMRGDLQGIPHSPFSSHMPNMSQIIAQSPSSEKGVQTQYSSLNSSTGDILIPPDIMNSGTLISGSGIHLTPTFSSNSVKSAALTFGTRGDGDSKSLLHRYVVTMAICFK